MKVALCLLRTGVKGIGGDPATVYNLAMGLKRNGIDVVIITPKLNKKLDCKKIEYIPYPWKDYLIPVSAIFFIKKVRELAREVDIIHCFYPLVIFEILNWFIKIRLKKRLITTFGTPFIVDFKKIQAVFKKDLWQYVPRLCINNKFILKFLQFKADRYTVSTKYQKRQLESLDPNINIRVIPNGIDVDRYTVVDSKKAKSYFGFDNDFIITYIGHFTHMKGVEVLIRAFRIVIRDVPESMLVLAISSAEKDMVFLKQDNSSKISNLIKGIEDRVLVLGLVDVKKLFSASDAVVFPYLTNFGSNMLPTLILEALAVGVPIISTQVEIIKENFNDHRLAILVPPNNPYELARALLDMISDEKKREDMIRYQRKVVRERYNFLLMTRNFLALYKE